MTIVAGNCINLKPGFRATAGSAATTFHAWAQTLPMPVSVAPASGSGMSRTFTWTASSPAGHGNLTEMYGLFNTVTSGVNGCYIKYDRGLNRLFLANNAGLDWGTGFLPNIPNSSETRTNSQCTILGNGALVSPVGNQLAVTVPVTFQSAFSGLKTEYLKVQDDEGLYAGLQPMGTWTVPGAPPQYTLITNVSPVGAGTVTLNPAGGVYASGTVVQMTATPAAGSGYTFTEWSVDVIGTDNPKSVTMTTTKNVTANFQAAPTSDFSLLSRTGSQIVAAGKNGSYTVNVQPINGFSGTVSFSASGLPSGATATFSPQSVSGSGTTTLTLSTTTASEISNPVSITITGTSGSLSRATTAYLMVNPPGYTLHPASVELNIGGMPLDKYLQPNDKDNPPSGAAIMASCPASYTVRQCIAKYFNNDPGNPIAQGPNGVPVVWNNWINNWIAQGITGVRFFFGVAGGYWSTPYIPNH